MNIVCKFRKKIIFMFLISLLHSVISIDVKDHQKFYFCSGKIFVNDFDIDTNEINKICNRILFDDRILISIQKEIEVVGYTSEIDNYYTRDSEEFFMRQCARLNPSTCDYGYMISLYTKAKKVRITAGRISKNIITTNERTKIINNSKSYLSNHKYADAIVVMVDLLKSSSPYISDSSPRYENIRPKKEESSGTSFWMILLFIVCPCLCCLFFLYRYYQTVDDNHTQNGIADQVHQHLNQLNLLLQQIKNNSPPVISTDQCLICMNRIIVNSIQQNYNPYSTTMNDMHNNLIIRDDFNTRYSCGHVYHNMCLNESKLTSCLMCPGNNYSSMIVPNNNCFQVVDDNHVKNLIRNINMIYDKYELDQYNQCYPNEYSNYNSSMALGLAAVGGVAAIAGTAYVLHEINQSSIHESYQQPMYNQSHYSNNYGSDAYYPDTAGGDFD